MRAKVVRSECIAGAILLLFPAFVVAQTLDLFGERQPFTGERKT